MPTSSYDALQTHPGYPVWPTIAPLPNEPMMYHIGAPTVENFLVVAEAWGQLVSRELTPNASVLDIGCGCGRTARMLLHHPYIRAYVGFDVIKPYVEWSTRFLSPFTQGRFQFVHLDVQSDHYNPLGAIPADKVTFPFADASFTLAFAASLFTHLKEAPARHYLAEARRVLAPGGLLIASVHVEPEAHSNYSGGELRAEVREEYFVALASGLGLALRSRLGSICGQETFVFTAV
jgi:SAM-dependent methyltransferase